MSEKLFVFPNHPFHKEARRITSTCPLIAKWGYHLVYDFLSLDPAGQSFVSDGRYPKIDWFQLERDCSFTGGVNLANRAMHTRDSNPIRQVGYRLPGTRSSSCHDFNHPTAFEILSYGVGIMRPLNPAISHFYKIVGGDGISMVSSHHMKATHALAYQCYTRGNGEKDEYYWKLQMTNLIFADTYGELEQLPKLSKKILNLYIKDMKTMCTDFTTEYHFGCLDPFWKQHIQSGIWQGPPESVKELLKRVDFILKHTFIDENPTTILKPLEYGEGLWGKEKFV